MRFLSFLLFLSSLLFSASPEITTTMSMQELNKLTASDGASDDNFGISVAISGDTAIVGAYRDSNDSGAKIGSAYIYERDSATGLFQQTAKLTASDGADGDYFGCSVAMSGDTVVVGAYYNDDSGSAYLYEKPGTGWSDSNQTAKLTASDGADGDNFGYSVAISGDSVVVGANRADVYVTDAGAAYIYEKPGTGWANATQTAKLTTPYDGQSVSNQFGGHVTISGDTVVVGASGYDAPGTENSGAAYIYEKPGIGWVDITHENAKLAASDTVENDYFGVSVAISGDTVVVGAHGNDDLGYNSGSAYIYEKPNIGWVDSNQETAKLLASDGADGNLFGVRIAMSGDSVVVGAWGDDDSGDRSGSAYIFEKPGTGWADSNQESAKLTASDGAANDYFGYSVAISGDTVVIGAFWDDDFGDSSGSAYIFENALTQNSIENKKDIIDIEASDADADYPIIFSMLGGSDVSLFDIDASTGLLSFKVAPDFENPQDVDANNTYEATIKLTDDSGESNTYAVSIRVSDVAYEGPMPKALSFKELNKLTASNGEADNHFGYSTAISGSTLIVGAYGYDIETGRAYIYQYNTLSDQFEQVAQLKASDGTANDRFGRSVAISNDTAVVGASMDDVYDIPVAGSAYIFEKPGTGWADSNQTAKLTASDGAVNDYFGTSVAMSGDTVVVGALYDDDSGDASGSAYIYEKPGTGWADSNQERAKLTASDGADGDYFGVSVGYERRYCCGWGIS